MLCTPDNWRDVQTYYNKTYVKFREKGDTLYYISSVNEECLDAVDSAGNFVRVSWRTDSPYLLDYALPHKAVFQYKDTSYCLGRIPAKQYYRGISEKNTSVTAIGATPRRVISLGFNLLEAFITKQQYYSLKEALSDKRGYNSYALSSRMSYSPKTLQLYVDTTPVATYNPDTNKIHTLEIFKTNVQDLVDLEPFLVEVV